MSADTRLTNKIMITRPAHQAGSLINSIQSAGGQVLTFPTLEIQPLSADDTQLKMPIASYDIFIFISPNAVDYGVRYLQQNGKVPASSLLATVGPGSARAIEQVLGRTPEIQPEKDFNSEGLLQHPKLVDVKEKHILIVKGKGGRPLLQTTLSQRGATVEALDVYKRVIPEYESDQVIIDLQNHALAAIVITSGESLQNLVTMIPDDVHQALFQVPLVLVNERIADIAKEYGFTGPIYLTYSANDENILQVLTQNGLITKSDTSL